MGSRRGARKKAGVDMMWSRRYRREEVCGRSSLIRYQGEDRRTLEARCTGTFGDKLTTMGIHSGVGEERSA